MTGRRGIQGAVLRGLGGRDHVATVVHTERIAPHCVRITMTSPTLFDDVAAAPTAWLRFWFPDPTGGVTEHQRAYTIVSADPDAGTFGVDVVLHEPAGPASTWASNAEPGMTVSVVSLGSTPFAVPDDLPAGFLLVGDSASIPAINAVVAALPADVDIEIYLELHCDEDRLIPLTDHPRRRLHWVPRTDEGALAAAIEDRDWSNWSAWVGAEAGAVKHLRRRLRDSFGFPKTEVKAQAYWTKGRAMGIRRDGDEDSAPAELAVTAEAGSPAASVQRKGTWRSQAGKGLLAPVKRSLVMAGILQGLVTLLQLAPFIALVELAQLLLDGADDSRVQSTLVVFVALLAFGTTVGAGLVLWLHVVDMRFSLALRRRLLDKLSRVPLGWFTERGSGTVKKLIHDDTLALHYLVTHAVCDAVAAVVAPIAVLAYLFAVDWAMALVLFIPIVIYVVTTWTMVYQSGPKIAEASQWAERMNSEAAAFLEGQQVIRVFGGGASSSFRRQLDAYIGFLNEWQRPFIGKKTFMDLVTRPTTFLWMIVSAGTAFVIAGWTTPAAVLPFLVLGTTFGSRLLGIGYGLGGIREGMQSARRIAVTLDEPELGANVDDVGSPIVDDSVSFERVSFGYRPGTPVIHDVSLTLGPRTVTALVGVSGSGKSTLAGLLARFHDVDSGAIRIGGRDVRSLTPDELYTHVGFVLQDIQLVAGTVRDNIALARPDAVPAEIESAAKNAQIHDRILQLPNGYDTVLGSDSQLSGGERQRITIARALLADTPVLVLDEATAFADPESEYLVQQALNNLVQHRTVLVIAHRLHTIVGSDQIIVLDSGRVVERGTHSELVIAGGCYRRLWNGRMREQQLAGEGAR